MSCAVVLLGASSVALFLATPRNSFVQVASWFVPMVMATGLLWSSLRACPAGARSLLRLLLLGQVVYVVASAIWYIPPVALDRHFPFPSWVDALYFVSYALYAVFLLGLLRRCFGGRVTDERVALLDALLVTTALSAVLWVAVVTPQISSGASAFAVTVVLAYPAFNLLLFALADRLIMSARLAGSIPGILLLTWIGEEIAGDVFYGIRSGGGTFVHGDPLSVTWMVAYTGLAALAAHPEFLTLFDEHAGPTVRGAATRETGARLASNLRLGALLLCALAPIALATLRRDPSVPLFIATAVCFALVTYRAGLLAGDLSEQRRLADELSDAVWLLRDQRDVRTRDALVLDSTDDAVITLSLQGTIVDWNNGAERLYGYTSQEAVGHPVSTIAAPESSGIYESAVQRAAEHGHATVEGMDRRKDGGLVHTSVTLSRIVDPEGRSRGVVAIARDVTARRQAEREVEQAAKAIAEQARQLEHLAFRDPVTGLGNRAMLRKRADAIDLRLGSTALLLLDLDGFKEVNDTLGHAAGDALLLQVGDRIGRCVRTGDTVVRLGGDEFAVLLPESGGSAAAHTAERILMHLRDPFDIDSTTVTVRGSIGIALGNTGSSLDELLRNADLAMYEAKAAGRDQARTFDPVMYKDAAQRLKLDTELRTAIGENEFTVFYQPIVSAATGEVSCLEALARWNHPQRGLVAPFEFVPAAERSGLIAALGRFVLRAACAQVARWRREWPDLAVAVNVSQRELLDPDYATTVENALRDNGVTGDALHLEITETVLAAEDDIGRALERLTALGVELSIDDFGTGHSSLSRLRDLPVRRLKVDKSFLSELRDDGRAPLLGSIIALAHSLDRIVVAEGVETPQQARFLVANGCDELQGYLYGRPASALHIVPVLLATRALGTGAVPASKGTFSTRIVDILEATTPLSRVVPELLAELAAISGLRTTFMTEVSGSAPSQVVRFSHNSDSSHTPLEEGFSLDWEASLCRRMVDDGVMLDTAVRSRFGSVEIVDRLDINTYVTVPIRDASGAVRGTLAGLSHETVPVPENVLGLMQLFAQALEGRTSSESFGDRADARPDPS